MKAVLALCVAGLGAASAFVPATKFSRRQVVRMAVDDDRSIALPYAERPANLDGTLPGDVGFDPIGFTNDNPPYAFGGFGKDIRWYREAELVHGRIAMLAALGLVFPYIWHWPGNAETGLDAFAATNPFEALSKVPSAGIGQIGAAAVAVELYRLNRVIRGGADVGDLGLGQGEGPRFNPFGFSYTEEEYREKQLQEIKNGRLAMIASIGLLLQAKVTGEGLFDQIGDAIAIPNSVDKAGSYFPGGL